MVGDGETLWANDAIDLIEALVENGHYVNVLTNGTVTQKIRELIERMKLIENGTSHICFHLSLHYMELKRKNLLDTFFDNTKYIDDEGISFHIKMIIGEEFDMALAEEVKKLCKERAGAYPQVGIARKDNPDGSFSICTNLSMEDYMKIGDSFHSGLFDLDKREFNKKHDEFCYAGDWSFSLNFSNGLYWECLSNCLNQFDFFEHPEEKLKLEAVGRLCNRDYCSCTNFQAWGLMPEHEEMSNLEVYGRPEAGWIKEPFTTILAQKLYETNTEYSEEKKEQIKRKRIGKECAVWERCYDDMSDNAAYLYVLGDMYVNAGKMKEARRVLERIIEISKDEEEKANIYRLLEAIQDK